MIQAHVICCNDSIEYVFIGQKHSAETKCREMRDRAYKKQYDANPNPSYEDYCHSQYWHVHSVNYE